MVSVQLIITEAIKPMRESVPYSLNKSKRSPVAAEDENIFTIARGTNSEGKPMYDVNFPKTLESKSKNPEALKIPTAVINPISVGIILITVESPLLAPFTNSS